MNHNLAVHTIIAGCFFNETIINQKKETSINKPGGEALYTAAAFNLWHKGAGVVIKISEYESTEWIDELEANQINTLGIKKATETYDQQRFYAIEESNQINTDNPQKHFFEIGSLLPKSLLGYEKSEVRIDKRNKPSSYSLRPEDFPSEFLLANNLILCPIDFFTHSILPPFFRSRTNGNVILCAANGYMHPSFWYDVPPLISGVSVFLATEAQVRNLFLGKMDDLWEMMDFLSRCGVEIIGIQNDEGGLYLYDSPSKIKYFIPPYPSIKVDSVGIFAAFCGGFGAGFTTHFDPLRAGLMGCVSASICQEGSSPFYLFNSLPGLASARLEALSPAVTII